MSGTGEGPGTTYKLLSIVCLGPCYKANSATFMLQQIVDLHGWHAQNCLQPTLHSVDKPATESTPMHITCPA